MFDPYKFICRDIFCVDGFVLGPEGCTPDPDANTSSTNEPIGMTYPKEMGVELTVTHKLCLFVVGINDTVECLHPHMSDSENFLDELMTVLSRLLQIERTRLVRIEVINWEMTEKTITNIIEDYKDNNDDWKPTY